jgi:hypothetical protein
MASEHMNIATSFLKELYKNGKFATNFFAIWLRILNPWIPDNQELLIVQY